MSIFDVLFSDEEGPSPQQIKRSGMQSEGVWEGPEMLRIQALPARRWEDSKDLRKLVDMLSSHLATPEGQRAGVKLYPLQAAALRELHDLRRLSVTGNVGVGKTLIGGLAPVILEAKRPLWLVYARLVHKTAKELTKYAQHWKVCQSFKIVSVESLSRENGYEALVKYNPDLIVFDEAHAMKSPKSGRTRKILRFLAERPDVVLVPLTGTPGDDSLANIAHVQEAVHRDASPVPRETAELRMWCEALDPKPAVRRAPGDLSRFAGGSDMLEDVRQGVGRRISETPGNVFFRNNDVACSLYFEGIIHDKHGPQTLANYAHIRENPDETITGQILEEGTQVHLSLTTCGLGFVHVIDPPPPPAWRAARKVYGAYVREVLEQELPDYDTPAQVVNGIINGHLQDGGIYERWRAIRDTFKPVSKALWFDEAALEYVAKWAKDNRGLIWVPYPDFAKKLTHMTGLPFFHNQGLDSKGNSIETFHGKTSAILSTQSNYLGRNLQDRYSSNLVIAPSSKSDLNEQIVGRTHRQGQEAEAVEVFFFLTGLENVDALTKARARARFDKTLGKNESAKLLIGDWMVPSASDVSRLDGPAWHR